MVLTGINVFSLKDWKKQLNHVLENPEFLASTDREGLPCGLHWILLTNYMTMDSACDTLLEALGDHFGGKETPWVKFLVLYKRRNNKLTEELTKEVDKLLDSSQPPHLWVKEGCYWIKEELGGEVREYQYLWWQWTSKLARASQAYYAGRSQEAQRMIEELQQFLTQHKLTLLWPQLWVVQGNNAANEYQAMEYYLKASELARETNNTRVHAIVANNLGYIYQDLGDFEAAVEFFKEAIQSHKEINQKAGSMTNLAYLYFLKGNFDRSWMLYKEVEALADRLSPANKGFMQEGIGLHLALRGKTLDALPYFNMALENYIHANDIHNQIELHANVAKVFYDNREFDIARIHFNQFLDKLFKVQSFASNFQHYAFYLLSLLDEKDMTKFRQHLDHFHFVAATNKDNKNIKAWYNYVLGMYERDQLNLTNAESRFNNVTELTVEGTGYDLFVRNLIALAEIKLRKFLILGEQFLLDEVEGLLEEADLSSDKHPVFPTRLFVKIYLAMLLSYKRKWFSVRPLVREVRSILADVGDFNIKKKLEAMVDQVDNQARISSNITRGLVSALAMGTGRQFQGQQFSSEEIGVVLWKFTPSGPETVAMDIPDALIPEDSLTAVVMLMGTLFITVVGQGDRYHQGFYGPLPVPSHDNQLVCLLSSKLVKDTSQEDKRLGQTNYAIIAFIYPALYETDRYKIQELVEKWWEEVGDLGFFNAGVVTGLKRTLLAQDLKILLH